MTMLMAIVFTQVTSFSGCQQSYDEETNLKIAHTEEIRQTAENSQAIPNLENPVDLISLDSLLSYLEDLTSIQPYSGWRNAGSIGEVEALNYVTEKLRSFSKLQDAGLEIERQSFKVYLSTEIWDSVLTLEINGKDIVVPAEGLRASRFDKAAAAYFDTDGGFNDSDRNPVTANGSPLMVKNENDLYSLKSSELRDRILFLDYSLLDRYVNGESFNNAVQLMTLMDMGLAGVVLVTQYSNKPGESHGTILGDGSYFQRQVPSTHIPILFIQLENLQSFGISTWEDLKQIDDAKLLIDADVYSAGTSGNVIARIPGNDSSKAVILGAHIDSPNVSGAFDDGSGSAALLEIARVLDVSKTKPPVDIYLAWFGGHEIGTYGSAYFSATHQELLDRTLAVYQMDCLGQPLEGTTSKITMFLTSYGLFGDESLPLPDFLSNAVADQGITLDQYIEYGLIADNSNFDIFNVPNTDLVYVNTGVWRTRGSDYGHYANHFHDPYETVEKVRQVGDAFVEMTKVMLTAALESGREQPNLRVPPTPNQRALIVASHTESVNLTTALFRELGMALAWEGFDVDLIPYGQAITSSDLENTKIVILPPTLDYPGPHNETWSEAEISMLNEYVLDGGFLVVTNTTFNYSTIIPLDENNEDSRKINALLEPMGIKFGYGNIGGWSDDIAKAVVDHPLTEKATFLTYNSMYGVPFTMENGVELMQADFKPIVGLVNYGGQGGQVLVIADLGILQTIKVGAKNLQFLKNIALYARSRQGDKLPSLSKE
jgi:hypothetical protein